MSVEDSTRESNERHWFADGLPIERRGGADLSPLVAYPAKRGLQALRKVRPVSAITRDRIKAGSASAIALEIDRGTPFLLVPVLLALGAFGYFSLSQEPALAMLLAAFLVAGVAALVFRASSVLQFAALAVFLVVMGGLLAKIETIRTDTKMLGGEISTRLTGRIVHLDTLSSGRIRLTMDVLSTASPVLKYAPQRVRLTARRTPDALEAGSIVSGLVKLRPPSGPVRPDSYDFSFESYFDGIGASGFFMTGPVREEMVPEGWPSSIRSAIENARNQIAAHVRARIGGPQGEIAAALLVGVRAGIPDDVSEALRKTGIYHIISISGLHMALVAGIVISGFRAGLALFPNLASRHPVRKYAAFAGLLAIAGYLVISGGEVAAQRSFLMLAVMLAAILFDRSALTMRNLAISAIIVLVVAPHEVLGPSFQMSYAATAALVGAYGLWSERRGDRKALPERAFGIAGLVFRRGSQLVVGLLVTSLVAGLATTAYGAYHFQRVSPLSLPANLAVMPIVSGIVVPFAVLAAIAMPFGLDGPFLDVMGKGIGAMIWVAERISARSPIDAVGLISGTSVVFLTIALVIATVATTWLRWCAVPVAIAGCLTLGMVRPPDLLIAEDAGLIAYRTSGDQLAINRPRGSGFTTESWMRALALDSVRKSSLAPAADQRSAGFVCAGATCSARHPSGVTIVLTSDEEEARRACATAAIIVVDDATTRLRCADPHVAVITKRQLAKFGSAAVFLPREAGARPDIDFAIESLDRPWHSSRIYSREARGLAPYRPKQKSLSKQSDGNGNLVLAD